MTDQEKTNLEVQMKLAMQDAKFAVVMNELKEQREDIRNLNARMDSMNARIDSMNTRIDSKFDALINQIHNLTVAAVVGFSAIAVAIGGLVISALK